MQPLRPATTAPTEGGLHPPTAIAASTHMADDRDTPAPCEHELAELSSLSAGQRERVGSGYPSAFFRLLLRLGLWYPYHAQCTVAAQGRPGSPPAAASGGLHRPYGAPPAPPTWTELAHGTADRPPDREDGVVWGLDNAAGRRVG